MYEKIKNAKYDIKENALWLQNFYINSLNHVKEKANRRNLYGELQKS